MATNFLYGPLGTTINIFASTEMNSLANNAGTVKSAEFGGANKVINGVFRLHLASNSLAFTANSYALVFWLPTVTLLSGAATPTYTSGAAAVLAENNYRIAKIDLNPKTQAANVVEEMSPMATWIAGFGVFVLINRSGVAWPTSGNTLDFTPTPIQY